MLPKFLNKTVAFSILALLTACSDNSHQENKVPVDKEDKRKLGFGSLMGDDFLTFGANKKGKGGGMLAPTVNPYLWRASLESINFMPLASADAFGGVIVTDWYVVPKTPNEKLKITIFITDQVLRADALKVIVYKQAKTKDGTWANTNADPAVATELENIILTKARQLRIHSVS
ncbi:MAG: DUF3576 domain-containing protein [Alphaproteobacteria bacterium]|nr:DUF3576 domain-containing protein [Alphaproteobacteria bacterium]